MLGLENLLAIPWWHKAAACRGEDSAFFFLDSGRHATVAKTICSRCPVIGACREWALNQAETPFGVWGGLNQRELVAESEQRRALQVA